MHHIPSCIIQGRRFSSEISSKLQALSKRLNENKLTSGGALQRLADGKERDDSHCTAAVLVPLCLVGGKLSLLYTVRSKNLSRHRGEVSFPGGNRDQTDVDLVSTALRETHEEIGVKKEEVRVLGLLNPVPSRRGAYVMPVCGLIENFDSDKLDVNSKEVDLVFTRPVEQLISRDIYGSTQFRTFGGFILPVYKGEPRVWGLTAVMTHMVLSAMYSRKEYGLKLNMLRYKEEIPKS